MPIWGYKYIHHGRVQATNVMSLSWEEMCTIGSPGPAQVALALVLGMMRE